MLVVVVVAAVAKCSQFNARCRNANCDTTFRPASAVKIGISVDKLRWPP
jgi:hypothetical protein